MCCSFHWKVRKRGCDSLRQCLTHWANRVSSGALRLIALAGPESRALQGYFSEYRAYDNRPTILVVQRCAASTAIILCGKPQLRVAGYERRLRRSQQRPAFLESQPQLLEIVINSVKNRQASRFASQVRIGAFHSRFDDQFHGIASSAGNVGQDIRPFPWTHQRDIDSSHGLDRSRALRKAQADEALGRH